MSQSAWDLGVAAIERARRPKTNSQIFGRSQPTTLEELLGHPLWKGSRIVDASAGADGRRVVLVVHQSGARVRWHGPGEEF